MQKTVGRQTRASLSPTSDRPGRLTVSELVFIGVGGIIGAGFFLGSGMPIRTAGPAVLLAYLVAGLLTSQVIGALASMSINHPVAGSLKVYADLFVGRYIGFLQGWAYYVTSVLTIASEAVAMAIFTKLWIPFLPTWLAAVTFTTLILIINAFGVKNFSRVESIMSIVKIAALIGFVLVVGIDVCMRIFYTGARPSVVGGTPGGWFPHGLSGVGQSMLIVVFAYAGIGVFGTAATEMRDPNKVDRAAVWTMVILTVGYLSSIGLLLLVEPWQTVNTNESPFVAAMNHMGLPWAAQVLNGVILVAAFSVMAASVFSADQILYSLGRSRQAPRFVKAMSRSGTEWGALVTTSACIYVTLLLAFLLPANVYNVLISASSNCSFLNWFIICWSFLGWRKRVVHEPTYFSKLAVGQPWSTIVTMCAIVILAIYGLMNPDQRIGFYGFLGVVCLISLGYIATRKLTRNRRA